MSTILEVGMKVVCISEDHPASGPDFRQLTYPEIEPVVGLIYTIRQVFVSVTDGAIGVAVEEIPDQRVLVWLRGKYGHAKVGWSADIFRPLISRKTDISIFTALLTDQRVGEPA